MVTDGCARADSRTAPAQRVSGSVPNGRGHHLEAASTMQTKQTSASAKAKSRILLTPLGIIAIAALAVAGLVSWSSGSDEGDVAIGRAGPAGNAITLPDLRNGRILPGNLWPSACQLVDQRDVTAILPEAEQIQQQPGLLYLKSIKEFAADPEWNPNDRAEAGRCQYSMKLPGETYAATQLWVHIHAIADPDVIKRYYAAQVLGGAGTNQGDHGADYCVLAGLSEGTWLCRKGPVLFSVGGQTTVAFKGKPAPAPFVWRDDVNPLIVETVAARIR
ncbi:hypothetical protein [Actinomadura fulvescens]|uniref:hypothetical protein n=1 Tax=Actinomadura fulvescens TaxID=46160 RepID=UPI0031DC34CA